MIDYRAWNNRVDRMLNSPSMSKYLFLGVSVDHGFPVLVPRARSSPHTWVIGPPGTGKGALFLTPYLTQVIANRDRSVVVLDFSPDNANLWNTKIECYRAGIPFRVFDPTPNRWSYVFNPNTQSYLQRQSLNQKIETLMQALSLEYGPEYDRAWFSASNRSVASDIHAKYEFESFQSLAQLLLDPGAFKFIEPDLWRAAGHLRVTIPKVAGITPLNVTANTPGVTAEVLANAIDMRQAFYQPQAIYFVLNSVEERTTGRTIAGLAAYSLFAAAAREHNPPCKVDLIIDGAAEFAGPVLTGILDRCRLSGINVTLVHQHLGQLRRADQDHAEALELGTGLQVVFAPTGQRVRKWIQDTAGTLTRPAVTWSQTLGGYEATDDDFHLAYASGERFDQLPRVSVTEKEVRAISDNDLMRWSAMPGVALVRLVANEGAACYNGAWIPTLMTYHISEQEYRDRTRPCPSDDPGTILVPLESEYDRRFADGPRESIAKQQLVQKIRNLRSRKK